MGRGEHTARPAGTATGDLHAHVLRAANWRVTSKALRGAFYATSLPPHQALSKRLTRLIREHWWVENKLHHVKTRTFLEDRHWLKDVGTAQTFTFLRTLTVGLLHLTVLPGKQRRVYCPEKIEYMRGNVWRPMRLLCGENDF
jgi:hypothetical protein